jgi:PAS domain S-box-containing protein
MRLFTTPTIGGRILRLLLPPLVLVSIVMHWLCFQAERRGIFPPGFEWLLDATSSVLLVLVLVWFVARTLHQKDVARQTAEVELSQSEERYRRLVEMSPLAIIVCDERRIEFANPAARALVGAADADEILGVAPGAFVPPAVRLQFEGNFRRLLQEGTSLSRVEQRLVRRDGAEIVVELSSAPVNFRGHRLAQIVARDITQRRQMEDAMRVSLARTQVLARATGDAVWDWDVMANTTWWSDTFYENFGFPADTPPSFGAWFERVHPDDRERAKAEFDRAIAQRSDTWTSEYRFRRPDGSYGLIFDRVHGICDGSGTLVRMIGSMVDISEVRRLEEEARLLAHAVESAGEMISITSLDHRFIFANRAFLETYGYTREEVIGRTPEILQPPAPAATAAAEVMRQQAMVHGWSGELVNRRKDGTEFPVQFSASPVRGPAGEAVALIGVGRDTTRRKQLDELLRASEERFRATFERAAMGITLVALDGRFLRVNQQFCVTTGYSQDELQHTTFHQLTHPADQAADLEQREKLIRGEIESSSLEKRFLRRTGAAVSVEQTVSLVRGANGAPEYFIFLVEDTTRRRDLEAQLRQAQKMEAVGQLAGGVAHDFNNMLTAIQGHASLLTATAGLSGAAQESLAEISSAARRAANLTRQLLLFSRREVMQPVRFDINEAVTDITQMLQRLISENVRIRLRLHPRPLALHADAGMLDQVLMNLAVNARDAMPNGGELTIATSEQAVAAGPGEIAPGRYACLTVTDTGCGIAPELLPRIFEPFFTTKEVGKGTGLGLATVFGIVKQHHGRVSVWSEPGYGTTFTVLLPLTDRPVAREAERVAGSSPPFGRGETVLLVEDDRAVRVITALTLKRHGYQVIVASHGSEALARWTEIGDQVDLLLTDMVMPGGVSGSELAAALELRKPGLKVLFTSGYSAEVAGRALELRPGQQFLAKPFEAARLLTMVAELLGPVRGVPEAETSPAA